MPKDGQANVFAVPDLADSEAGARFFAQHALDLAWAAGQEFIAREYESFTAMVVQAIERYDWSKHDDRSATFVEASSLATRSMQHRAEAVRSVVDKNHPIIFETVLCRYVDNFLSYVSDLLGLIMATNPRALADKDATVSIKDVLEHDSIESLHEWLIDHKVNDLTFQGFGQIVEYFRKKFGFALVVDKELERIITTVVAIRNLMVHKRGVIDVRFVANVGSELGIAGRRVRVANRVWTEFLPAVLMCVRDIDKRAAEKFQLQTAIVLRDQTTVEDHEQFMHSLIRQVLSWPRS